MKKLILSAMAFVLLCGCTNLPAEDSSIPPSASTASSGTTSPAEPEKDYNPLTGQNTVEKGASVRPVAIMINNLSKVRPQPGIDAADMYVEAVTEGGITRIMAVFAGTSGIPSVIGSVRSARPSFFKIAQSIGALYISAGGDKEVTALAGTLKVDYFNLNLGKYNSYAWRDSGLKRKIGLEHSLVTGGENIAKMIKSSSYSSTTDKPSPFTFGIPTAGGGAGSNAQFTLSGEQTVNFTYDPVLMLYTKGNGKLSKPTVHKASNGNPITISNVVAIYDKGSTFTGEVIDYDLKSGSGVYLNGGTSRSISWSRTASKLSFTESGGGTLTMGAGKTYICIISIAGKSATILK